MADATNIEWTDATWTPIRARNKATGKVGWHCEHASPGCMNCYSETFNEKRLGTGLAFKPGHRDDVEHFLDEAMLIQPLRWRRPRMVFVCSMTDLFGDWVPDEWIDRVIAVMAMAPQHTFQVLTKRADRMRDYLQGRPSTIPYFGRMPLERIHLEAAGHMERDGSFMDALKDAGSVYSLYLDAPWPLPNVWAGVSAEDQRRADERVPILLDTPAAVRWVSAEPLLGPIDFRRLRIAHPTYHGVRAQFDALIGQAFDLGETPIDQPAAAKLNWLVVGGESGPGARPMHPDWARSIRDQCAEAGVPFLFKQHGAWTTHHVGAGGSLEPPVPISAAFAQPRVWKDDVAEPFAKDASAGDVFREGADLAFEVGKKAAGRILDGVLHDGFPARCAR